MHATTMDYYARAAGHCGGDAGGVFHLARGGAGVPVHYLCGAGICGELVGMA